MGCLLVWNVRGLNRAAKQRAVREVCSLNKVEMCAFLETKLNKKSVDVFMNKFFRGWQSYINLEADEGGRILVLWRADLFNVSICYAFAQLVHCCVHITGVECPFFFSIVYGLNTIEQRKVLWDQLLSCSTISPWHVGGDFNTMFAMDNKLGGNPVCYSDLEDGISWLQKSFFGRSETHWTIVFLVQSTVG